MNRAPDLFADLENALWLADRLSLDRRTLYSKIVAGTTDAADRRQRLRELIRAAIKLHRCETKNCGVNTATKQMESFGGVFFRLYGENV